MHGCGVAFLIDDDDDECGARRLAELGGNGNLGAGAGGFFCLQMGLCCVLLVSLSDGRAADWAVNGAFVAYRVREG